MKTLLENRRSVSVAVIAAIAVSAFAGYIWHCNGGSFDFSDTDVMIVVSGSMDGEPRSEYPIESIPVECMVFVREVPSSPGDAASFYGSLRVGDVLTFHYTHPVSHEDMIVTHRIIGISESGGTYTYMLQGDSIADDPTNGSVQTVTSESGDVIGKVVGVSHWMGVLTVFLSNWYGKATLILIPCTVLIASEVRNIVRILRGDGRGCTDRAAAEDVEGHRNDGTVCDPLSDDELFRRI